MRWNDDEGWGQGAAEEWVEHMSDQELAAHLAAVAQLLHTARCCQRGVDVALMVAFGLGFEPVSETRCGSGPDEAVRLEYHAQPSELLAWVRCVIVYLLLASRGGDAAARDDAEWALRELGTTRQALLTDGRRDEAADRRIDALAERIVMEGVILQARRKAG